MDEDEEEFYDSLDEESTTIDNCALNLPLDSEISSAISQNGISISTSQNELIDVLKQERISTKIPLYVGETDKEDIKLIRKNYPNVNKGSSTCIACEASLKPKNKIDNTVKKKTENSYWKMYCQKNKLPVDDTNDTSWKSLYGSTKTFSSLLNSSSCLSGSTWDAPSVFEKYMPKTYAAPRFDQPTFDEEEIERSTITTARLTALGVDLDTLKSISQNDLIMNASKSSKISKSQSNTSSISSRPLSLKGIGPDSDKLELLRKQQEYGTRVNSRNRARIIQNLTKLKQELHDSKGVSQ